MPIGLPKKPTLHTETDAPKESELPSAQPEPEPAPVPPQDEEPA